ncbi:hypothetical protein D3C73_1132870 [compost metagenome]
MNSLYLMSDFCNAIKVQVTGFKPNVEDVPHLKRISSLFGGVAGAEALFNPTGVGLEVEETAPTMGRIEKMLAERQKQQKR